MSIIVKLAKAIVGLSYMAPIVSAIYLRFKPRKKEGLNMTNLQPLKDAVKLIADVVADSIAASGAGNIVIKLEDFSNVIGDLMVLIPELSQFPSLSSLSEADYAALIAELGKDLSLPGKPGVIVGASIKLISDISSVVVPDVQAIIAAAKA